MRNDLHPVVGRDVRVKIMALINKICFSYPTRFKEGMSKDQSCVPSPFFHGVERGSSHPILINVGLIINLTENIHINVEINHIDHYSPADFSDSDGKFENLQTHILLDGQAVTLTSLYLPDVELKHPGLHEIRTNLFGSDANGIKIDKPIDSHKSYFLVLMKD